MPDPGHSDGDRLALRRQAERRGHRAETIAAWALRLKGYRILARRYRTKAGEVDLVARRGFVLAFVEVKARGETGLAIDAVPAAAQERIRAAADRWLATQEARGARISRFSLRFDVVAVLPGRWPIHIENVF